MRVRILCWRLVSWGLLASLLAACAYPPIVVAPRDDRKSDWDAQVTAQLARRAQPGDWLVARGYKFTDHLVTTATLSPWSHVAIVDAEQGEVIEAEAEGVHRSSLAAFVAKSQHIQLVRPRWQDVDTGRTAVDKARESVGRGYDFLGTVGLDVEARYYCSELAIAVYAEQVTPADRIPRVIEPAAMVRWGNVVYDSGGFTTQMSGISAAQ